MSLCTYYRSVLPPRSATRRTANAPASTTLAGGSAPSAPPATTSTPTAWPATATRSARRAPLATATASAPVWTTSWGRSATSARRSATTTRSARSATATPTASPRTSSRRAAATWCRRDRSAPARSASRAGSATRACHSTGNWRRRIPWDAKVSSAIFQQQVCGVLSMGHPHEQSPQWPFTWWSVSLVLVEHHGFPLFESRMVQPANVFPLYEKGNVQGDPPSCPLVATHSDDESSLAMSSVSSLTIGWLEVR